MHNVVLIAGCSGAAKHSAWVGQIHPLLRVYITYTKADSVLFAATLVDGDVKVGTDPGRDRLPGPKFRDVDFEATKIKLGAHSYFVADPGKRLSRVGFCFREYSLPRWTLRGVLHNATMCTQWVVPMMIRSATWATPR